MHEKDHISKFAWFSTRIVCALDPYTCMRMYEYKNDLEKKWPIFVTIWLIKNRVLVAWPRRLVHSSFKISRRRRLYSRIFLDGIVASVTRIKPVVSLFCNRSCCNVVWLNNRALNYIFILDALQKMFHAFLYAVTFFYLRSKVFETFQNSHHSQFTIFSHLQAFFLSRWRWNFSSYDFFPFCIINKI